MFLEEDFWSKKTEKRGWPTSSPLPGCSATSCPLPGPPILPPPPPTPQLLPPMYLLNHPLPLLGNGSPFSQNHSPNHHRQFILSSLGGSVLNDMLLDLPPRIDRTGCKTWNGCGTDRQGPNLYFPYRSLCLCLQSKETRLTMRYSTVQLVSPHIWKMQKPSLFSWGAFVCHLGHNVHRRLPRSSGHTRSITETPPLLPAGSSIEHRVVRFLLGHARMGITQSGLPAGSSIS